MYIFLQKSDKIVEIDQDMKNPNKIFRACENISLEVLKIDLSLGKQKKNPKNLENSKTFYSMSKRVQKQLTYINIKCCRSMYLCWLCLVFLVCKVF